jgi:acyl-CoA dehydrogenase
MTMARTQPGSARAEEIALRVERFVRDVVVPYEKDPRCGSHGPSDQMVAELRAKARAAGVLTPHILSDGSHLSQRETATVLKMSGLSPLGPVAVNTMAPDEGNMYLIGKVGSPDLKAKYLAPLVSGEARSAFFMTEPAEEGGAGSDPSMMKTTAVRNGNEWVINGRKAFITGAPRSASSWQCPKTARACFWSTCPIPPFASSACSTRSTTPCRVGIRSC